MTNESIINRSVIEHSISTPVIALTDEIMQSISDTLAAAKEVMSCDDESHEEVVAVRDGCYSLAARIERQRAAVKAPVLELGRAIDDACKDHILDLKDEAKRLNVLLSWYESKKKADIELANKAVEEMAKTSGNLSLLQATQKFTSHTSTRQDKVVVIDDPKKVPYEVNGVILYDFNLTKIKDLLKVNVEVPGCHLEERGVISTRGCRS